ncbi:GntR family transcriptional regulator [Azorhizobium doebereinerae]|uniref:GntR family transcriptional regulator n=1 Tax=Azorhizobium doebereinerae TaxID=281091 RepID=UPI000429499C|nr:GntR family transcriptional regulator [Azorhizobium doebereinerae]
MVAPAALPAAAAEPAAAKPARAKARVRFKPARLKLSAQEASRPLQTASLHGQLLARLREMVLGGELRPGSPLPERMLCETFGVSRTPLREAFKVLATEGLIELRPHRTPVVTPVDAEEIGSVFQVMEALDRLAGGLACSHATAEDLARLEQMHAQLAAFHQGEQRADYFRQNQQIHAEITRLARNPVLLATWTAMSAKIYRARAQANYDPARWDASLAEHEAFMALLRTRDAAGFSASLASHTRLTGAAVLATLTGTAR